MLNLLFHFKSDTSEESLGNCLFHYVVSLNNVKVDVSLSVSLSLFQLKRETVEEAPGSLRAGSEEASVAACKIPPSPLCNHSVTGMCMIFTFSLCLTPCEALLDSFSKPVYMSSVPKTSDKPTESA